jgi:exopolysaccharide biosynthesis protein
MSFRWRKTGAESGARGPRHVRDASAGAASGRSMTRRSFVAGAAYGVGLVGFSAYTLLDAFVIPKAQASATSMDTSQLNSSQVSTASADLSSEGTATSTGFESDDVTITLTTGRTSETDYYLADIEVSSVAYLKCALAQGTYGRNIKQTTSEMAEENNAILAINGDYYGWRDDGFVVRNGVLYRDTPSSGTDCLVIGSDGSMYVADEDATDAQTLVDDGAWQVLSFGPVLVEDGEVVVDASDEVSQSKSSNPRTAIAMVEPLHYLFMVSDGRTSASAGLTLQELAEVLVDAGATIAYNLDGGGSSTMWFNGEVVNNPTDGNTVGERSVSDIVYIG